jgi:class 3 adenylate cyclase/tetratricopeptide (TPR) repeat protein
MWQGAEMDRAETHYQRARTEFDQGSWPAAISAAGLALAADPTHGEALNLVVAARQQLDLAADPHGERRILSVLMADLAGSTRLPRLLGPEGYREVLRTLHAISVNAVTTYEGRIAQYLGDGILAYFSYPEAHRDDPRRAVLAGLEIVREVVARGPEFAAGFGIEVQVRVGIDTGLVVVGALGAGRWTTSDSIVGDPPNVASRIQHLARPNTVVVSDATRRLVERDIVLRAGQPRKLRGMAGFAVLHRALRPVDPTAVESGHPAARPLIGREAEVAALGEAWTAVLAGDRRCVRVVGEAGIGKSRLAEHLVNAAHASGGRSIVLSCSALRRHVPFHPVAAAIRRYLGATPTNPSLAGPTLRRWLGRVVPAGTDLDAALPVISTLLGADPPDELLPEQFRERMLSVLVGVVEGMSAEAPLLLVVEDVHDADPSSLELLQRIISRDGTPLAVLVTSRPGGPELVGEVAELVVGPLDDGSSAAVVRQVLGAAAEDQVARLVERADGIPLYLEELARWSAEQQDGPAVPVTLSGVLTARLDDLPTGAREIASTASVIGTHIDHELLLAVSGLPEERLGEHLAGLVERQVLVRAAGPVHPRYRFRHALLRQAAYDRQVRDVRRSAHRRCAEVLSSWDGEGRDEAPAVVAAHYEEGADPGHALRWWGRAAHGARQEGADIEAIEQYGRALRLLDAVPDLPERDLTELGLRLGLGLSASVAEGYSSSAALEAFERADEIGGALPASTEWAAAIWGLWSFFIVRGELDRAQEQVVRARRMADELGDEQLASTTSAMAGYVHFFQGRLDVAVEELTAGLGSRATLLPNDPRAVSRALIGVIEWLRGDPDASERTLALAFEEARAVPGGRGAFTLAFISAYWAWLAQLGGDPTTAVSRATATVELAAEHNFLTWQAAGYLHLTGGLCEQGLLDSGLPGLEATIDAWQKAGAGLMVPYFLSRLASAKLAAGAVDVAETTIDDAIRVASTSGEHLHDAELLRLRARIRAARGAPEADVVRDLEEAVRVASTQGARVFALRGLMDLARHGVSEVRCADSLLLDLATAIAWWDGRPGPAEVREAAEAIGVLAPG